MIRVEDLEQWIAAICERAAYQAVRKALKEHVTERPAGLGDDMHVDAEQAAQLIGKTRSTLESWRALGKGPPFVRFGRRVRYRVGDLRAWCDAHKIGRSKNGGAQ